MSGRQTDSGREFELTVEEHERPLLAAGDPPGKGGNGFGERYRHAVPERLIDPHDDAGGITRFTAATVDDDLRLAIGTIVTPSGN